MAPIRSVINSSSIDLASTSSSPVGTREGKVSTEFLRGLQDVYWSDDEDETPECPLCMDEMDLSDINFKPCPCGYQICRFCHNHIVANLNRRCPACRREYTEEGVEFIPVPADEIKRLTAQKKAKQKLNKELEALGRTKYKDVRVIVKNMVYVVGMSLPGNGDEQLSTLRSNDYFGQYGKISKLILHKRPNSSSGGIYITYLRREDASRAIHALDGFPSPTSPGTVLRASYGTMKYCEHWLKGGKCERMANGGECLNLHDWGEERDCFTKEDLSTLKHTMKDTERLQKPPASASLPPKPSQLAGKTREDGSSDSSALPRTASWAATSTSKPTPTGLAALPPNPLKTSRGVPPPKAPRVVQPLPPHAPPPGLLPSPPPVAATPVTPAAAPAAAKDSSSSTTASPAVTATTAPLSQQSSSSGSKQTPSSSPPASTSAQESISSTPKATTSPPAVVVAEPTVNGYTAAPVSRSASRQSSISSASAVPPSYPPGLGPLTTASLPSSPSLSAPPPGLSPIPLHAPPPGLGLPQQLPQQQQSSPHQHYQPSSQIQALADEITARREAPYPQSDKDIPIFPDIERLWNCFDDPAGFSFELRFEARKQQSGDGTFAFGHEAVITPKTYEGSFDPFGDDDMNRPSTPHSDSADTYSSDPAQMKRSRFDFARTTLASTRPAMAGRTQSHLLQGGMSPAPSPLAKEISLPLGMDVYGNGVNSSRQQQKQQHHQDDEDSNTAAMMRGMTIEESHRQQQQNATDSFLSSGVTTSSATGDNGSYMWSSAGGAAGNKDLMRSSTPASTVASHLGSSRPGGLGGAHSRQASYSSSVPAGAPPPGLGFNKTANHLHQNIQQQQQNASGGWIGGQQQQAGGYSAPQQSYQPTSYAGTSASQAQALKDMLGMGMGINGMGYGQHGNDHLNQNMPFQDPAILHSRMSNVNPQQQHGYAQQQGHFHQDQQGGSFNDYNSFGGQQQLSAQALAAQSGISSARLLQQLQQSGSSFANGVGGPSPSPPPGSGNRYSSNLSYMRG